MATRFHGLVERRATVPLTADDLAHLEALRSQPELRVALGELCDAPVDADVSPTEAALLHALLSAGWRALQNEMARDGYQVMAAERQEPTALRQDQARRRPPVWANEG